MLHISMFCQNNLFYLCGCHFQVCGWIVSIYLFDFFLNLARLKWIYCAKFFVKLRLPLTLSRYKRRLFLISFVCLLWILSQGSHYINLCIGQFCLSSYFAFCSVYLLGQVTSSCFLNVGFPYMCWWNFINCQTFIISMFNKNLNTSLFNNGVIDISTDLLI